MNRSGGGAVRIESGGVELHVVVRGPEEAPPVVLVHGFPFSHRMWEPQLDALAPRFRVVAYDIRGLGRSEVGDGQYTMELFVDDLIRVLDGIGAERPAVCGLSMGGYLLLRALEREPDRIGAAVLCDTKSAADDDETRIKRARAIRALKEDGAAAYADAFAPSVLGRTTRERRPEVVDAVRRIVRANRVRGMVGAQLAMLSRTDTTEALAGISVPTLVVGGEEDPLTPPETMRALADRIPEARFAPVAGAGHVVSLESPDAFNRELTGFLEGLG